jgi:hypothetical protein
MLFAGLFSQCLLSTEAILIVNSRLCLSSGRPSLHRYILTVAGCSHSWNTVVCRKNVILAEKCVALQNLYCDVGCSSCLLLHRCWYFSGEVLSSSNIGVVASVVANCCYTEVLVWGSLCSQWVGCYSSMLFLQEIAQIFRIIRSFHHLPLGGCPHKELSSLFFSL